MKQRRSLWLVVWIAAACAVEVAVATGGWQWRRLMAELESDPGLGASRLVSSRLLWLPSVVHSTRRLSGQELVGAEPELVAAALRRISSSQLRWFPVDPEGHKNRARVALLERDFGSAQAALERALELDPTSPYLHRLMALVMRQVGRSQAFLEHMARAAAIAPGYLRPTVELTPEDQDWIQLAGLKLRVDLYPGRRVDALIALASEHRRRGDRALAEATLGPVEPYPSVQLWLAEREMEDQRYEAAAARASAVAESMALPAKLRIRAWSMLAQARDLAGDAAGGLEAAEEAMRLGPDSPGPYLALGTIAENRGDLEGALQHFRRAWGISPTDVGLLLRVASVAERGGHPADARLALERAVEVAPERADVAAALVELHLRNHDYMEAAMQLSRQLDRFPTDTRLLQLAEHLRSEVTRGKPPGY